MAAATHSPDVIEMAIASTPVVTFVRLGMLCSRLSSIWVAMDQTEPGTYLPSWLGKKMRAAWAIVRCCPRSAMSERHTNSAVPIAAYPAANASTTDQPGISRSAWATADQLRTRAQTANPTRTTIRPRRSHRSQPVRRAEATGASVAVLTSVRPGADDQVGQQRHRRDDQTRHDEEDGVRSHPEGVADHVDQRLDRPDAEQQQRQRHQHLDRVEVHDHPQHLQDVAVRVANEVELRRSLPLGVLDRQVV